MKRPSNKRQSGGKSLQEQLQHVVIEPNQAARAALDRINNQKRDPAQNTGRHGNTQDRREQENRRRAAEHKAELKRQEELHKQKKKHLAELQKQKQRQQHNSAANQTSTHKPVTTPVRPAAKLPTALPTTFMGRHKNKVVLGTIGVIGAAYAVPRIVSGFRRKPE